MNTNEKLYNLLPSVYRIRDAAEGEPLRALVSVIESEIEQLEGDIESLYDNWFIETCDEWVVPYIADLLGVRGVQPVLSGNFSLRPFVANTLAYRRRKGTATVIEQLAKDVTGWNSRVVEFFSLLSITSNLNHITRSGNRTIDLGDSDGLELLNSPFDRAAHTCEVRRISSNRGKYNIPNIGIFLWRLSSYPVTRGTALAVSEPADGRYTFNPLGIDTPLFNRPRTETEITHLAEEINVPGVLRRRPLYEELEARREDLKDDQTPGYFDRLPVFEIFINNQKDPIPPEQINICDLGDLPSGDWQRPSLQVAVDPKLGRLAFPTDIIPGQVEVSYSYGFSCDLGGGPYNRSDSIETWYDPQDPNQLVTWQIGVTKDPRTLNETQDKTQLVQTLQEAIKAWNAYAANNPKPFGIIAIMDSCTYKENLIDQNYGIEIPESSKLAIVAADWPQVDDPNVQGKKKRINGQLVPDGYRPHLSGNLSVHGTAKDSDNPGELILDGLLIEGKLTVLSGNLGNLLLAHCTLVPAKGGLLVNHSNVQGKQNAHLRISIDHSICGTIRSSNTMPELRIVDSIVDQAKGDAIKVPAVNADIQTSTILGRSTVLSLVASNSIFTGVVRVERQQVGCVRFSYLPYHSRTPPRYNCQPDLALKDVYDPAEQGNIRARFVPSFTSTRYGDPAYSQFSLACALEIRTGAENGSEIGAFNNLKQPQREANLRASLGEYLRFGLEAGIFYVT